MQVYQFPVGTQVGVYSIKVVRLIWGPLNSGFTITHLQLLPQPILQ